MITAEASRPAPAPAMRTDPILLPRTFDVAKSPTARPRTPRVPLGVFLAGWLFAGREPPAVVAVCSPFTTSPYRARP